MPGACVCVCVWACASMWAHICVHATMNRCVCIHVNTHALTEHFIRNTILILGRASLCSQNSLNSLWHGFHKMMQTFLWDSVPCWHDCMMQLLNLPFYHILKVFYWIQIRWLGRPLKNIELIVLFIKPVWDGFCIVTWCIVMLEVAIRRWEHYGPEGMHMVCNNASNSLWHSSDDWLVLTGPKCAKKTFPTQTCLLTQIGVHRFMLLAPNSYPIICMVQQKSRFIQTSFSYFGELVPTAASAFCSWLTKVGTVM